MKLRGNVTLYSHTSCKVENYGSQPYAEAAHGITLSELVNYLCEAGSRSRDNPLGISIQLNVQNVHTQAKNIFCMTR